MAAFLSRDKRIQVGHAIDWMPYCQPFEVSCRLIKAPPILASFAQTGLLETDEQLVEVYFAIPADGARVRSVPSG